MTDSDWPFDQARDTKAVTTVGILENNMEIMLAEYYADDTIWGFFCGTTEKEEDGRVVTLGDIVAKDSSLKEIAHMNPGQRAWRANKDSPWKIENV